MKKLFVLSSLFFCLMRADAQFPLARHFWLNNNSYNHTLSPTSDGGYILAAARQHLGANRRNTIAVFKLDMSYQIIDSRIIGIPFGNGFEPQVNFEVHDVIERVGNGDGIRYIICGSFNRSGRGDDPPHTLNHGMVLILDYNLHVQDFREYPDVEVFYSVYAQDNHYFVCGKAYSREGIVLQDDILNINPAAYVTNQPWEYQKVIANNNNNDIIVSGTDGSEFGFTVFNRLGFTTITSHKYHDRIVPYHYTKAVITNDPAVTTNSQQFMLSVSAVWRLFTYSIDYQPATPTIIDGMSNLNPFFDTLFLEDMSAIAIGSQTKVAWTGNYKLPMQPDQIAFYAYSDFPYASSSPLTFISYPSPPPTYFSLHKIHFNFHDQAFHCGGFYNYFNNNKTTFVVAPEQAIHNGCGMEILSDNYPQVSISDNALPVIMRTVNVNPIPWHEMQYNFCITDCDGGWLIYGNKDCGNEP